MHQAVGVLLLFCVFAAGVTAFAAWAGWWFEPGHRTLRALNRRLEAKAEVAALAPLRGQGVAMRVADNRIALVRGPGDLGLVFDLDELFGVELIFDGQVAARMFRRESRRPLDQIAPEVRQIILRLVFDDVRDPEFELHLLAPADLHQRRPPDPDGLVLEARRWFARLEAVLRRAGSDEAAGR
jgi:hypothetical protein